MTCDRRHTLFAPVNTFNFTTNDRLRRYSTPDRQDLETIYEVNRRREEKKTNYSLRSLHRRIARGNITVSENRIDAGIF